MKCDVCSGTGKVIDPQFRCQKCRGEGMCQEKKELELHIEKGASDGSKVTFFSEGDWAP
ncbi:hypothetical protein KIPB_016056, partial [Kipferlia bialata]|eukprot:g16056.t1